MTIKKLEAQVKALEKELESERNEKSNIAANLQEKFDKEKESLQQIIKNTSQIYQKIINDLKESFSEEKRKFDAEKKKYRDIISKLNSDNEMLKSPSNEKKDEKSNPIQIVQENKVNPQEENKLLEKDNNVIQKQEFKELGKKAIELNNIEDIKKWINEKEGNIQNELIIVLEINSKFNLEIIKEIVEKLKIIDNSKVICEKKITFNISTKSASEWTKFWSKIHLFNDIENVSSSLNINKNDFFFEDKSDNALQIIFTQINKLKKIVNFEINLSIELL